MTSLGGGLAITAMAITAVFVGGCGQPATDATAPTSRPAGPAGAATPGSGSAGTSTPGSSAGSSATTGSTARGGGGPILSAFFGLDNRLPVRAAAICPPAPGLDGLVVVVSDPLERVDPRDWSIITRSGAVKVPTCASLLPAIEAGERRTVLLIGELGDAAADAPARVEITAPLATTDPERGARYRGATFEPVTPLADGPSLVIGVVVPEGTAGEPGPAGDPGRCPAGTIQVVRVAWSGGVTRSGGGEPTVADVGRYHVVLASETGPRTVEPTAIVDIGDNDNYHELCLGVAGQPLSVRADAGSFVDPNNDPNPATEVAIPTPRP